MTNAIVKALIVVTSHGQLGNTGKQTGYYLTEVTHPYHALVGAGIQVDIASPKGGEAPMDSSSRDLTDPVNLALLDNTEFMGKLTNTLPLQKVKADQYSAILFAGGHGTMWDFANNPEISRLASEIFENGGIVSAVCHGPAALIGIRLSNGQFLISGKKVTGFSNDEEAAVNLTNIVPFALETELKKQGATYEKAALWQEHVTVDGRLITGQNPASAKAVGEAVALLLKK